MNKLTLSFRISSGGKGEDLSSKDFQINTNKIAIKRIDISLYGSLLILLVAGSMLFLNSCGTSGNDHLGPVVTGFRDIHPDSGAVTKVGP